MNDYLSELLDETTNPIASQPANVNHAKEAKNVKATRRYLEFEGPGVHEFFQYSHFYKAKLGSGVLELIFTDDIVKLEGKQDALIAIAEEVSIQTLASIKAIDPVHAQLTNQSSFVAKIEIQSR